MTNEINQQAVARFIDGAKGATTSQIMQVLGKMQGMLARGEMANDVNLATMRATVEALELLVK